MADSPPYQQHRDYLLGRSPELAGLIVDNTQATMRACGTDTMLATDRSLLFQVAEAVQTHRITFQNALTRHIQQAIQEHGQAGNGGLSLNTVVNLDELTLVDEDQAEQEIEVSRTVQLVELSAEWELRELQAFTSTLQGETRLRPQDNPFRPAAYAKALSAAVRELALTPNERQFLLRLSGKVLAEQLKKLYAQACERLRQQGLRPLAYKAAISPRRAPPRSDVNVTQPGALEALLGKLPASVEPATAASGAGVPSDMAANKTSDGSALTFQTLLDSPPRFRQTAPTRTYTPEQVSHLLSRLFAQMHHDQEVQPAVRSMIEQLQPAVMRVAHHDPQILRSDQHPAWRLINQLASYASGYGDADHAELTAFLQFAQARIQQLVPPPGPTMAQLETTLAEMQRFIDTQTQAQLESTPQAIAHMQEADLRLSVRPVLRQQVEQQIGSAKVKPTIQDFLLGPWVDVLTHLMACGSSSEEEIQAMMACVDDLLHSLQRPRTLDEREALRQSLPDLIDRLKRGMAHIDWPMDQQEAILNELMRIHGHHLVAQPKAAKPQEEPTAADLVAQMREDMDADHRCHARSGRHAQLVDTNLGTLPTVPMAYGEDMPHAQQAIPPQTPAEWTESLHKGMWCKLFLQGQWATAHLLWTSSNRQFFMFTSEHAGRMHAMTRRALERLRSEGLATNLEDRSLMQRAVDSLLQDLA
ncbi:MAG: DUF1631 family protein [Aquabacterium sp.]|uniref:DUF1631 family protein n=1 Tax=Aquabacterium sp. TaxID=1872578 RepID=UPI0025C2ECF3|nr:DUF1631 family protein [Aquabacterium sp.]MBI5925175.1 DUF1631 family protein [Aquabacterium sp.]